jgi:hypothetical protein
LTEAGPLSDRADTVPTDSRGGIVAARSKEESMPRFTGTARPTLLALAVAVAVLPLADRGLPIRPAAAPLDRYVATTGSDSTGDGTKANPWATIGYAADHAPVGDSGTTVHVAPGTYPDLVDNTSSGRPGAYLAFVSDVKWGAHIATGGTDKHDYPFDNEGSYVRISGFDVTSTVSFVGILSWGHDNIIEGNRVHDIMKNMTRADCNGSPGGVAIGDDQSAHDNSFIGNWVFHTGWYPNECPYVHGIYPSGAHDLIANNVSYQNAGNGIAFNHNASGATIVNNLSFSNADHGISIESQGGSGDYFVIANNITVDNVKFGIAVHDDANGAHNQYRNNLFWRNGKGKYGLISTGEYTPPNTSGTIAADPGLVDYRADGTGDYHPTAGSPAVDAGTSLDAPATDYDGNPRPQGRGYDIGPYEYPSPSESPSPSASPSASGSPSPPPSASPSSPPSSGAVTADFEDGTTQGWAGLYGNANPRVVTDVAYEGSHALRFSLATGGHSAVGTSRQIGALRTGTTVIYHVWADQTGTVVRPFVRDARYNAVLAGDPVTLPAQQWTTVSWQVPTVPDVGLIGLDAAPGTGSVVLDALVWPT